MVTRLGRFWMKIGPALLPATSVKPRTSSVKVRLLAGAMLVLTSKAMARWVRRYR
jgi:hypothetical protein